MPTRGSRAPARRRSPAWFGTTYAVTRRLFALMCAHTAFDLTALALIYWDVETDAAHRIFR